VSLSAQRLQQHAHSWYHVICNELAA
jgi:hypothetical protein